MKRESISSRKLILIMLKIKQNNGKFSRAEHFPGIKIIRRTNRRRKNRLAFLRSGKIEIKIVIFNKNKRRRRSRSRRRGKNNNLKRRRKNIQKWKPSPYRSKDGLRIHFIIRDTKIYILLYQNSVFYTSLSRYIHKLHEHKIHLYTLCHIAGTENTNHPIFNFKSKVYLPVEWESVC